MATKVLLIGYTGENTIRHLLTQAAEMHIDLIFLDLESFYSRGSISFQSRDSASSYISLDNETLPLDESCGVYQRIIPPFAERLNSEDYSIQFSKYIALQTALQIAVSRVINRPGAGWENSSKPLQMALLKKAGFNVPVSLSTSIPDDFVLFSQQYETIYKSNSSVRSIVESTERKEPASYERLRACPVLFQSRIKGYDVRIHTVDGQAFGVKISSDVVDYRYSKRKGGASHYAPITDIPNPIRDACLKYAQSRGIIFAGFDFKVDFEGKWYCLEMNPMPGYEGYDKVLDHRITQKIFTYLSGES